MSKIDSPFAVDPADLTNIPVALREIPQWVAWRADAPRESGKKPNKVPVSPSTGSNASTSDPATWSTFGAATTRMGQDQLAGVGFVFTEEAGIVGVDLDHCVDPETGEVDGWALDIVQQLASYTEFSPSGTGIHVLVSGQLPPGRNRSGKFEVYAKGRYFTVTGKIFDEKVKQIEERTAELKDAWTQVFGDDDDPDSHNRPQPVSDYGLGILDEELIEAASVAKNGAKFEKLYGGDWRAYSSRSEADLALCSLLAYRTGDPDQIDRLFRESGLMRAKWNERRGRMTYGEITVATALKGKPSLGTKRHNRDKPVSALPLGVEAAVAVEGRPGLTDIGNAERLRFRHGQNLRYVAPWGWVFFNGTHWQKDELRHVELLAKETVRAIIFEEAANPALERSDRDALIKHGRNSESDFRIRGMLSRGMPELPGSVLEFDRDPMLLNVENGTIDLRTGTLREHRREDMITKIAPVVFDPEARSGDLEHFLNCLTGGDLEYRATIERFLGYGITGCTDEDKFALLTGPGGAGKSTLLEGCKAMGGDYVSTVPFSCLLARENDGGGPRPELARLSGARIVTASEVEEEKRFNAATIKSLCGGDSILVHGKYKDPFELQPQFKLFLAANIPPRLGRGSGDSAARRRLVVFPFNNVPAKVDRKLRSRLKEPQARAALLVICVRGCLAWQREGLGSCTAIDKATAEYWGRNAATDDFDQFLKACCIREPGAVAAFGDLHEAFSAFLSQVGQEAMTSKRFAQTLDDSGFESFPAPGGKRMRRGLRLLDRGGSA